jgi:hypothetical protein
MQRIDTQPNKPIVTPQEQQVKFNFAITGQAEGNELEIIELLHFAMTELNMTCGFIKLHWYS